MSDAFAIASSGLRAASAGAATAASNLANARSGSPAQAPYTGYVPREAVTQTISGGGVAVATRALDPASLTVAGTQVPNVDEATEILRLKSAERSYAASASLIRTQDAMSREMIDLIG